MNTGKEINLEEIKILQMDVLTAIDKFCRENKIRYSMACGTMLGAARHGGYIPWDDDIDIYVPREDYKILMDKFPQVYEDRYKIVSLNRDKVWDRPYAKAYDIRTILFEPNCSYPLGINIDIFPIDDVPDDISKRKRYDRKRRFFQDVFALRFLSISSERAFFKNVLIVMNNILTGLLTRRKIAILIDFFAQKYNGRGYTQSFENVQGIFQKSSFPKILFNDLRLMKFEDRQFMAFKNFDQYLSSGFGNWMQLPPKEKQISHHAYNVYWK